MQCYTLLQYKVSEREKTRIELEVECDPIPIHPVAVFIACRNPQGIRHRTIFHADSWTDVLTRRYSAPTTVLARSIGRFVDNVSLWP